MRPHETVHCAHRFLTTRGYINFGVGCVSGRYLAPGASKGTVVVVGAGMAGLAAARQLMQLGHRVAVVEGRDRAGGRVWTRRLSGKDPPLPAAPTPRVRSLVLRFSLAFEAQDARVCVNLWRDVHAVAGVVTGDGRLVARERVA